MGLAKYGGEPEGRRRGRPPEAIRSGEQVCGTCRFGDFGEEVYPGYGTCRYEVAEQVVPLAMLVTKVRGNIWRERGRAWPCPVWFPREAKG